MTIILTLANNQQVIQVSDRKLTSGDGSNYKSASNKATILFCRNGRFGVGYTGIAETGSFNTQSWIIDSLIRCKDTDLGAKEIFEKFCEIATVTFKSHKDLKKLSKNNKRLTVVFSGYFYVKGDPLIGACAISNFQDFDTQEDSEQAWDYFKIHAPLQNLENNKNSDALIFRVGAWKAIKKEETAELMNALINNSNPNHIRNKALGIIREMSDRPETKKAVGKDLTIIRVPADKGGVIQSEFHPYKATWEQIMADQVWLLPGSTGAVANIKISPVEQTPETAWGRTMGLNRLCFCGSNRRFTDCHGKNERT